MTARSDRGRPLCRDYGCDVEIEELGKYCSAHEWNINRWLKKSREILDSVKEKQREVA